jgi:cobalt-zinc-cadmium efflux system outer membrane protein
MIAMTLWLLAMAGPVLTVDEAVEAALATHPAAAAEAAAVDAAFADARQAGAWANPEVFFRLEGAPRDGDAWSGGDRLVGVSQALPLGGAPAAGLRAARSAAHAAALDADAGLLDLEARVRVTYAEAWHAVAAGELRREARTAAGRLVAVVEQRVAAGDAAQADLHRARASLAAAEADVAGARAARAGAMAALAELVGAPDASALTLASPVSTTIAPADSSRRQQAAAAAARAAAGAVDQAGRQRWPEVVLEAGLRKTPDTDAFDVGVGVAVPLFDRGGARLEAARARQAEARHRADAVTRIRHRELAAAIAAEAAAVEAVRLYEDTVVPQAAAALAALETAYEAGDAHLGDVLQVRRDWLAARQTLLDWQRSLAAARASALRWR